MTVTENIELTPYTPPPAPFVELQQTVASRADAISPFVDQLMRFVKRFTMKVQDGNDPELDIEIAVREALANAIIHGNHGNPHKQVYVTCRCTMDGEVRVTVQDQGDGFVSLAIPDPTDPGRLLLPNGRGLYLMRTLMDEVSFEDPGNIVRMRKKLGAPIVWVNAVSTEQVKR